MSDARVDDSAGGNPASDASLEVSPPSGPVVVFGGSRQSGWYADTWVWDGATWSLAPTSGAPVSARCDRNGTRAPTGGRKRRGTPRHDVLSRG